MSLATMFGFSSTTSAANRLPEIYPFNFKEADFIQKDVIYVYSRILLDVLERTEGIPEDKLLLFMDNCVGSEVSDGMITLLAKAMCNRKDLYLVYRDDLNIVREANQAEKDKIAADYKAKGKSADGVFITFKNYERSEFLKIYSALEYCTISSLYKNLNLSKAVQIKTEGLRASVGAADATVTEAQAVDIAEALKEGRDIHIDAKDIIEMLKVDVTPTKTSMDFINGKKSFYLGLPASWLASLQSGTSLSDTGQADTKAVNRGLRPYYYSIIKPTVEAVFNIKSTSYQSDDFEEIATANETLKTFDITSEKFISTENKQKIINRGYKLPADSVGDKEVKADPPPTVVPSPKEASI